MSSGQGSRGFRGKKELSNGCRAPLLIIAIIVTFIACLLSIAILHFGRFFWDLSYLMILGYYGYKSVQTIDSNLKLILY